MKFPHIKTVTRMPAQWRLLALQQLARWGVREETLLIGLAVLIGLIAGGSVWVFEKVLHFVGTYYLRDMARQLMAWRYGIWLLPILPAAGGLAVVGIRKLFRVPFSHMHGLPAIMYAMIRGGSVLRPTMGLETLLASSVTLGTGGSGGPEAPIAVIGSSVGSIVGNLAGVSRRNLPTLIGCGAAAGISAVFSAPIAGVLFALEVMLRDFSVRTFMPIVISAVISTVMYQTITGEQNGGLFASTVSGNAYHFTFHEMPYYLLLGILCGVLAVVLTRSLNVVEHAGDKLSKRISRSWHPAIGAGLSGVCGVALILMFHHYTYLGQVGQQFSATKPNADTNIFAVGYPAIYAAMDPKAYTGILINGQMAVLTIGFLTALCAFKLIGTSLTLGAGGSGGVFAPSLYIGATGGGALGALLHYFNPDVSPNSYAIVGMGAVLAAGIQAPLMSILLLFELTRNYEIMLPAMLAAVTATAIQQFLVKDSMYTLPLRNAGVRLGSPVGVSALRRVGVDQLATVEALIVNPSEPVAELLRRVDHYDGLDFVVIDEKDRYVGMLTADDLRLISIEAESAALLLVGEVVRSDVPPLLGMDTAETAFSYFARYDVGHLATFTGMEAKGSALRGLLGRGELMQKYHAELSS